MKKLTIGKFRGIQNCSTSDGILTCLALDHRQNLRKLIHPQNPSSTTMTELRDFKLQLCRTLSTNCSAVLLDPEYSAAQAIADQSISKGVGLVVSVEATGYTGTPQKRESSILENWDVKKVKLMGADAIKLLVYYHPASPKSVDIEKLVSRIAESCNEYDILFMLEPLSYSLDKNQKPLSSAEKKEVIIQTVKNLTPLGPDILKVEFPLEKSNKNKRSWADAFSMISKSSYVPWLLLSAGVPFQTYQEWVRVACENGASGVAVGRAVWNGAVTKDGKERLDFLENVARSRLSLLMKISQKYGRSIFDFFEAKAPFSWFSQYHQ